jgi:hypothetical protein
MFLLFYLPRSKGKPLLHLVVSCASTFPGYVENQWLVMAESVEVSA